MELNNDIVLYNKPLLQMAKEKYDLLSQLEKTVEECGELVVAIQKYKKQTNSDLRDNMLSEIADVYMMMNQLIFEFPEIKQYLYEKSCILYHKITKN